MKKASKLESLFHGKRIIVTTQYFCVLYTGAIQRNLSAKRDIISDVANTYVDNIPAQIMNSLHGVSMFSNENLHTSILPTSHPIHGFSFIHFWTIMEILSGFSLLMI